MSNKIYPKNLFATLPRTTRGVPLVLGGDPKGKNFLYTNRNSVIIRDINNPGIADVYTEHSHQTVVAKYSPSGFYIASSDITGKVRIWDTTQKEHILKCEVQPISGPVKDLAWSPDSKRIAVGGQGREKFCHAFLFDSGSSVGDMYGHSKGVNSIDYRNERPYRIVTGSEDYTVGWFHGPPFKHHTFYKDHKNFVNCVRYDPTGAIFMSGGADGKILVYEGKDGASLGELGGPAHRAGVYALSFNKDGTQVLSVSADKTAKIWDCATLQLITEFPMGKDINDMQLGCLWQNEHLLTVSLSGYINYLDVNNPDKPHRIIKGHNNLITALAYSEESNKLYTGSSKSEICQWNCETGENEIIAGKGHLNQIQDITIGDGCVISVSVDDTVRFTEESKLEYSTDSLKLDAQPKAVSHTSKGAKTVIACINQLVMLENKRKVFALQTPYEPTSIDVNPQGTQVAVGGKDNKAYFYAIEGNTLSFLDTSVTHTGEVTGVKYSPDGQYLLVIDANRRSAIYNTSTLEQIGREHNVHSGKLLSGAWNSDSSSFCIGSLDTSISLWKPPDQCSNHIRNAHMLSAIHRVCWTDTHTVVSAGNDCNLKLWSV